ncbi:MAG TPA: tRNA (adenosine(37)-N6)-threonylcarbamoyltransferase complex dimerization subunit type 1 TsaB [Thermoanaerobaculia bacterium]|nr:tRNA (adenosine(37)-N6)-threonylcarbamoyltransferase complex dimerization subunit type 1 TsaB [Thermoanaerobaculia bacterium]
MLILATDTSLPILSVALIRDAQLLAASAVEGKNSRNEKLLPAIDWVLNETGSDRREIDLFAVTRGPGSFTGVRIGLATMQGMALALGKPVCAMSTHEAIAPAHGKWLIVDDAGRGEFYVSEYEEGEEVLAPRLARSEDLVSFQAEKLFVADVLRERNVALSCARRAEKIALGGRVGEYGDITPIYVRLAEAEVKLKQK